MEIEGERGWIEQPKLYFILMDSLLLDSSCDERGDRRAKSS
jgi:hypothetical protein